MKKSLLFLVAALCLVACTKEQKPEPAELLQVFVANADSVCAGQVLGDESNATTITSVAYADSTLLFACTLSDEAEIELELLEATADENLRPEIDKQVGEILSDSIMEIEHPEVLELLRTEKAKVVYRFQDADGEAFELVAKQY